MVGHGEDQRGAPHLRFEDALGDRRRIGLVEKGAVDGDRAVERRRDAFEGAGEAREEGGVGPDQDHLDADDAAMR
ncbi:MAG: hypothetical protein E5X90_14555, partial [Mesorhizobium sp.]